MRRTRKRLRVFPLVVIALMIFAVVITVNKKERTYVEDTVIVSSYNGMGTLWDIAKEYRPDDMSTRDYVDYIIADNDCTSVVHNGDVLKVRIYQ